ncbi:DUF6804 family protein [Arthrobacter sp. OAP107]|uniref:DUF6804 family protein n=1 Tax=Arthrobacter sp. OAP107 TaxID=3156445 RepID=UPI00339ABCDA
MYDPTQYSTDRWPAAPGFTEEELNGVPLITVHPAAVPAAIGAVFLMLAVAGGAQYEFYVVLRWAVTAMAIWMSVVASALKRTPWVVVFVAIALLFNPLIPVYATRSFWAPFDLAGFVLFWVAGVKLRASKPALSTGQRVTPDVPEPRSTSPQQGVSYEANRALKPSGSSSMRGSEIGDSAGSVMEALQIQKMADDAAFSKLYYVAPDSSEAGAPLDLLKRGFQVMAGGSSLFCSFMIRGNTEQHDGLVACTGDKIGLFTVQSLAASGGPLPGDRIMKFDSIKKVAFATIPGVSFRGVDLFTAVKVRQSVMTIRFDNDEVWDLHFPSEPVVGHGHTPYRNFVNGFHDEYQTWHDANKPRAATLQETAPVTSMSIARMGHTGTLLPTGRVLIVGGSSDTAELYDPSIGTWKTTASMTCDRYLHTATLLPNGTVFVAGGSGASRTEIYDEATGTWTLTATMAVDRWRHTATLLRDGTVLIAGGSDTSRSAEIYDPTTGKLTPTGNMSVPRSGHAAILLRDGTVLVCGGAVGDDSFGTDYEFEVHRSVELYDPATKTWSPRASMADERTTPTAVLLPNGKVLVTGGGYETAEMYDPATGSWSMMASMAVYRAGGDATLLPDGTVLVSGGTWAAQSDSEYESVSGAELFDPVSGTWSDVTGIEGRTEHTATLLANGDVLIAGGFDQDYEELASAVVYQRRSSRR